MQSDQIKEHGLEELHDRRLHDWPLLLLLVAVMPMAASTLSSLSISMPLFVIFEEKLCMGIDVGLQVQEL